LDICYNRHNFLVVQWLTLALEGHFQKFPDIERIEILNTVRSNISKNEVCGRQPHMEVLLADIIL
jgi:hypothetical protein